MAGSYFVADNGTVYYPVTTKNSTENFNDSNYNSVFGKGGYSEIGAGLTAGTKNGGYYLSLSKLDQDGIVGGSKGLSNYLKYNARFNSRLKITDKLKLKSTFSYSNVNSNRIQQGSNLSGLLLGLYRTPADFDNRDYKGTKYDAAGIPNFNSHRAYRRQIGTNDRQSPIYNNPLWTMNEQKNPNTVNRFVSGLEVNYSFNDAISFIARGGYDHYTDDRQTYFPIESAANGGRGSFSESLTSYNQYNVDFIATAFKSLSEKLTADFLVGYNINQKTYAQRGGSYVNFILDSPQFFYGNALIADRDSFISNSKTRTDAVYGTVNFDFNNVLFLNLTTRAEKASTFGANQIFVYPSAEFSFNFGNLKAFEDSSFLSSGKLRLTAGQTGQEPAAYGTNTYYTPGSGGDSYGPGYSASGYDGAFVRSNIKGDSNLKPEITTGYEAGLDLKFFDNRVSLSGTYYQDKSTDILFVKDIAASTGYSGTYTNAGAMENKGFEIDFNADVVKNNNFTWNIFANWSTNKNTVTDIKGTQSLFLAGFQGTSSRAVEGYALGTLWGGKFDRDASGNLILDANGFPTVQATEGVLGDPNPDWKGGVGTSVQYKGFKLSGLIDASIGGDAWDGTTGALTFFGRTLTTANEVTVSAADAASIVNYNGTPITAVAGAVLNVDGSYTVRGNIQNFGGNDVLLNQAWYRSVGGGFGPVAEQFIKDASWVKLRELSLSYTLDSSILDKTGLNSIQLSLTGRNLWLWTKDDWGQDPESNLTGASNGRGLQYFNHPTTKSYLASIKINF